MVASVVKFLAYMTTIFEGLHVGYSLEFQTLGSTCSTLQVFTW